ncbi:MAG TPA: tyrosine-type recombinase/integrase [Candidatus Scybalomonas excrementigallinarum]|nr:tyrosine-type recombinase/integrase [Candidatus Scybalomonas excrementigallinarum]
MKEDLINSIILGMMPYLNEKQLEQLKFQLRMKMTKYKVEKKSTEVAIYDDTDLGLLKKFLEAKAAARKSVKTLRNYGDHVKGMILGIGKKLVDIDEDDISMYLYRYQVEHGIKKTTARNIRASISSFFSWLRKTGRIDRNPMDLVEVIRPDQTIKEVFTDEQIIQLREECTNKRDLALVDFLNSSMIRVGELQQLNRSDIEFNERECIVFGKGSKERIAYFDGNAKLHLQAYLEERKDNNPALFVGLKPIHGKYERLTINGIQDTLRRLGKRVGFRVHPHKFRRSGATRNLEKGMDLYDLKDILGHTKIETTLIYARKRRRIVKMNYERFNM